MTLQKLLIFQKKKKKYWKEDKAFSEEHKSEIMLYENALSDLKKSYSKLPNSKKILKELDSLHKKEYPNARVFFCKIPYERTVSNQKNL